MKPNSFFTADCPICEKPIEFAFYKGYPAILNPPDNADPSCGPEIDPNYCPNCDHEFTEEEYEKLITLAQEEYEADYEAAMIARLEDNDD